MLPTISAKQYLISFNWAYFRKMPKKGELIVIFHQGRRLIKRVQKVRNGEVFVIGDNKRQSTDSRHFGWIKKNQIIGKVIYTFSA